jgi:hypothetical protein|tara:strand:- start:1149 stop:1709 length:561 start_codon:yes stop_codon:yes gene_type:complete
MKLFKLIWSIITDPNLCSKDPHYGIEHTQKKRKPKSFSIENDWVKEYNGETLHCRVSLHDLKLVRQEIQKHTKFHTQDLYPCKVQWAKINCAVRYLQYIKELPSRNKDRTITNPWSQEWLDHRYHEDMDMIDDMEAESEVSAEEAAGLRTDAKARMDERDYENESYCYCFGNRPQYKERNHNETKT